MSKTTTAKIIMIVIWLIANRPLLVIRNSLQQKAILTIIISEIILFNKTVIGLKFYEILLIHFKQHLKLFFYNLFIILVCICLSDFQLTLRGGTCLFPSEVFILFNQYVEQMKLHTFSNIFSKHTCFDRVYTTF